MRIKKGQRMSPLYDRIVGCISRSELSCLYMLICKKNSSLFALTCQREAVESYHVATQIKKFYQDKACKHVSPFTNSTKVINFNVIEFR